MKYNDVKTFLELIGKNKPFAVYFTKTLAQIEDNDFNSDYFEVSDYEELLENSLLVITDNDGMKDYYLFDLEIITQLRTNY